MKKTLVLTSLFVCAAAYGDITVHGTDTTISGSTLPANSTIWLNGTDSSSQVAVTFDGQCNTWMVRPLDSTNLTWSEDSAVHDIDTLGVTINSNSTLASAYNLLNFAASSSVTLQGANAETSKMTANSTIVSGGTATVENVTSTKTMTITAGSKADVENVTSNERMTITAGSTADVENVTSNERIEITGSTINLSDVTAGSLKLHGVDGSLTLNIDAAVKTTDASSNSGDGQFCIVDASTSVTLNFSNDASITTARYFMNVNNDSALTINVALTDEKMNALLDEGAPEADRTVSYTLIDSSSEGWGRERLGGVTLGTIAELEDIGMVNLGTLVYRDGHYYNLNGAPITTNLATYTHEVDLSQYSSGYYAIVLDGATAQDVKFVAHAPEPTTATLSLLALAGLCARRRRH